VAARGGLIVAATILASSAGVIVGVRPARCVV
jgi:hypothetical protein